MKVRPWAIPHPDSESERDAIAHFDLVCEAVTAVRQIRSDYAIPPGKSIDVTIQSPAHASLFNDHSSLIGRLSRSAVKVGDHATGAGAAHAVLADGSELTVPLGGLVDVTKECGKLRTELEQLEKQLAALTARLQNHDFTSRAPAHVVDAERKKQQDWTKRRAQISEKVKALCGG